MISPVVTATGDMDIFEAFYLLSASGMRHLVLVDGEISPVFYAVGHCKTSLTGTHCLREADTVARMGGDEFTILLPRITSENDYLTIADKTLEALRIPFAIEEHELQVSSSIGVSLFPRDGEDPETLIKKADDAMYLAKRGGKNMCRVYSGG